MSNPLPRPDDRPDDFGRVIAEVTDKYGAGDRAWVPCSEGFAGYMLDVLPPALMRGWSFAVGEPYTHDAGGLSVYLCILRKDGKFSARYANLVEFGKDLGL